MHKIISNAAAMFAAMLPLAAAAQWQTAVDLGMRHARVAEYNGHGQRIVVERGWLPGLGLALDYRGEDADLFAAASIFDADLDYDGRLQNGRAYRSETRTTLAQARLGARYRLHGSTRLVSYAELDHWRRDIEGSGNAVDLRERSLSPRLALGLEQRWVLDSGGRVEGSLAIVRAARERLKVGFSGLLDDASFHTRSATGFAADLLYYPWAAVPLSLGMRLESIKVPRSGEVTAYRQGQPSGTLAQPEHVRHAATLFVRYSF
jgi:hypothetical protein